MRALFILLILFVIGAGFFYVRGNQQNAVVLPSSTATVDGVINWQTSTSTSTDHPYSFDYPEDWHVKETTTVTRVTYSSDVFIDIAYITPSAFIDDLHSGEGSFTERTNPNAKQADVDAKKLYIVDKNTADVGGFKTRTLEYCILPQEDGLQTETCILSSDIIFGENTYNLTLNIRNASLATQKIQRGSYRAIFHRVIESMKPLVITTPTPSPVSSASPSSSPSN